MFRRLGRDRRGVRATVVIDLTCKRVLWVGQGRSREEVRPFFQLLFGPARCKQLVAVAMDMNAAYDLEVRAQDRLLNLRLLDEVDEQTFATKNTELRDRIAELSMQVQVGDRERQEQAATAEKVFELSQTLAERLVKADCRAKRQLLEILCLNLTLRDTTLVATMRQPFGARRRAAWLVKWGRQDTG